MIPNPMIHRTLCWFILHGCALDIAGQGIANPIATMLSAAMLCALSESWSSREGVSIVLDHQSESGPFLRTRDIGQAGIRMGSLEMGVLMARIIMQCKVSRVVVICCILYMSEACSRPPWRHRVSVDALPRCLLLRCHQPFRHHGGQKRHVRSLRVSRHCGLFCLQVTTYGRRTRNVVPIFAPVDVDKDEGYQPSSGEEDEASCRRRDMKDNSREPVSQLRLVRSTTKSKTPKTLRVVPASTPTSKAQSGQNFPHKKVSVSKAVTSDSSAVLGRSSSSCGKWYDEISIDELLSPAPRVPLGNIKLPNTTSRLSSSAAEHDHEATASSGPVLSQACVARQLAKAAPLLKEWKERNIVTSKAFSDVKKRKVAATMTPRKLAPRSNDTLSNVKRNGLYSS